MDELDRIREQMDELDIELVKLFTRRMELSAQIAQTKQGFNMPIFVPEREAMVTERVREAAGEAMAGYTQQLYERILELSRAYQRALML